MHQKYPHMEYQVGDTKGGQQTPLKQKSNCHCKDTKSPFGLG